MFRKYSIACLSFGVACLTIYPWDVLAETPSEPVYRVGVAQVDITPDYPVRLNGFGGRRLESEGVRQRIYAKALAIQSGEQPPLVLVTVDNLGVRLGMVEEVAKYLAAAHHLPCGEFGAQL